MTAITISDQEYRDFANFWNLSAELYWVTASSIRAKSSKSTRLQIQVKFVV